MRRSNLGNGQRFETLGATLGSSLMTLVAAPAGANSKGGWIQLIAATAFDAAAIEVIAYQNDTAGRYGLDVGVGGAGSEKIVAADLHWAYGNTLAAGQRWLIPVQVPAGTRVAVRVAASAALASVYVGARLIGQGEGAFGNGQFCDTYGFESGDTSGIQIDPGAVLNTKGAWVQVAAALTRAIRWAILDVTHQGNTAPSACGWLLDLGIGAGGAEVVKLANIADWASANARLPNLTQYTWPLNLPSGTRVAVRAQCSITDATDRLLDVVLHGIG